MDCTVSLATYAWDNKKGNYKQVLQPIPIPGVEIDENTVITFDQVIKAIAKLDFKARGEIAAFAVNARKNFLTNDAISKYQFIGNTTIGELTDKYPDLKKFIDTEKLGSMNPPMSFNIIQTSRFSLNGMTYSGRVIDGKNEFFVIRNYDDAKRFAKYVRGKVIIAEKFKGPKILDKGLAKELTDNMGDLKAICLHNRTNLQGALDSYLDDRSNFAPFYSNEDKKLIVPAKVFSEVFYKLAIFNDTERNYTDLETAVRSLDVSNNKNFKWKIPRKALYGLLCQYSPSFAALYSEAEFNDLNKEEMRKLLLGNKNKLFLGHPHLGVSVVDEITPSKKTVITTTSDRVVGLEKGVLDNSVFPSTTRDAISNKNISLSDRVNRINALPAYKTVDEKTGVESTHKLKASVTTAFVEVASKTDPSKKVQEQRSVLRIIDHITKEETKDSPAYVTLSFPFKTIEDAYGFGYGKTGVIFKPVESKKENIADGKYKGMYIYQNKIGDRTVYVISRSVINPHSYMRAFPTLQAAKEAIEAKNDSDIISKNSLWSIKAFREQPRETVVEMENLQEGQILTTIRPIEGSKPRTSFGTAPNPVRNLLNKKMSEVKDILGNTFSENRESINSLDTPEKVAMFVSYLTNRAAASAEATHTESEYLDVLRDNNSNVKAINDVIDKIHGSPLQHYYVERLDFDKIGSKKATLRVLSDEDMTIDTKGSTPDTRIRATTKALLESAVSKLNDTFNIKAQVCSLDELKGVVKENNLKLKENDLRTIKAFVCNNRIYINAAIADVSDLFHETTHILLGALKVNNKDAYSSLVDKVMRMNGFSRKLYEATRRYKNFAREDVIEEAVADTLADRAFKTQDLALAINSEGNSGPIAKACETFIADINRALSNAKSEDNSNGLGFDSVIKMLSDTSADTLKRRRMITNLIQQKIKIREIIENC